MASCKLILRKDKVLTDGSHPIIIQILKDRQKAIISLGISLYDKDWDISKNLPKNGRLAVICQKKLINVQELLFEAIDNHWTARRVADIASGKLSKRTLFCDFARKYIDELKSKGYTGNAYSFELPVRLFCNWLRNDIPIQDINYNLLTKFVKFKSDIKASTRITYLSKLRAIYNEAAERDLFVKKTNPFKKTLFKGNTKTEHRNLTVDEIRALFKYELYHNSKENDFNKQLALDVYKFGFLMRGMDMIDIAQIKQKDFNSNAKYYHYTRKKLQNKSNKKLTILIPDLAREIARKYLSEEREYLFPFVKNENRNINKSYRSYTAKLHTINKYLKRIGNELGISIALTSKTNRHTFASIAKQQKVPYLYIQELLGHSLNSVTDIYMDAIPQDTIDHYHLQIIESIIY